MVGALIDGCGAITASEAAPVRLGVGLHIPWKSEEPMVGPSMFVYVPLPDFVRRFLDLPAF